MENRILRINKITVLIETGFVTLQPESIFANADKEDLCGNEPTERDSELSMKEKENEKSKTPSPSSTSE